ncbi:MAG: hypothetical protein ACRCV9_16985 [Burkholderiaceae bacterium]
MKLDRKISLLVASIALGAALGAVVYYTVALKYRSIGVLALESTLAEYKRFSDVLANKTSLAQFISQSAVPEKVRNALNDLNSQADPFRQAFTPIFRVSKADLKELGESPKESDFSSRQILGARLTITHRDPAVARESIVLLANYTREELLRYQLVENVSQRLVKLREDIPRLENETLAERFNIDQMQSKIAELRKIVDAYPKLPNFESRQVISIDRGTEKFLSPLAQQVAAESEVVQIRQNLNAKERELRMAALELQYLGEAQKLITAEASGSALAIKLSDLATKTLKPAADKDEWARVVFNRSMMDIDTARERFERQVRFISDPSLPIHPEKPGALTFILGLALLGFFGTALVLYRKLVIRFLLGDGQDSTVAR